MHCKAAPDIPISAWLGRCRNFLPEPMLRICEFLLKILIVSEGKHELGEQGRRGALQFFRLAGVDRRLRADLIMARRQVFDLNLAAGRATGQIWTPKRLRPTRGSCARCANLER